MINTQTGLKKITKIVTFYEDGTFTESYPSQQVPMTPYISPYLPPAYTWPPNPNYTLTPNLNPCYTSPTCGTDTLSGNNTSNITT